MKYTKYSTYSYNLHVIKTNKFKTVTVQVNFKRKLIKDEITIRNLLINVLCTSTHDYDTKRLMNIACEDLYELQYQASNYISGRYNIMSYEATFLNEKYTEVGYTDKSIKFLSDLIFKPNVEQKRGITYFKDSAFKIGYNSLKDNLFALKENPDIYSKIRMYECMEPNSCISYRGCGYIEDLESIDSKKLYEYYTSVLNSDTVDIFVIGDVNNMVIKKLIESNFKMKTLKKPTESHFITPKKNRLIPKTIKEKMGINQSKLSIGFKIDKMTDFERRYVLNVYSYILGGGPDSKLFKNVREKNSLCYYINSTTVPLTSTMSINAGINAKDYKKTLSLIKSEVSSMRKGKFDDDDIIKAKITYINGLKELEDNAGSLISLYAGIEYLNSHTIDQRFVNINKVSKNDVVKLANKIHMDTIYLLEGDLNEKN